MELETLYLGFFLQIVIAQEILERPQLLDRSECKDAKMHHVQKYTEMTEKNPKQTEK